MSDESEEVFMDSALSSAEKEMRLCALRAQWFRLLAGLLEERQTIEGVCDAFLEICPEEVSKFVHRFLADAAWAEMMAVSLQNFALATSLAQLKHEQLKNLKQNNKT